MASFYNQRACNKETIRLHSDVIENGKNTEEDEKELISILGGIDNILALFLLNGGLTVEQLTQIQTVLQTKSSVLRTPSIEEMSHIFDEIDTCSHGQSQSPINLISCTQTGSNTQIMTDKAVAINPLQFNYPAKVTHCTIVNNGHTVQVNINALNKCTLSIHNKTYELKQFHFHTPSEHTIDAKQYDMEMHLVHLSEKNEIAVLGFLFTTQQKYVKPKLQLTQSRAHLKLAAGGGGGADSMLMRSESSLQTMHESGDDIDESDEDMKTDDEWDEMDTESKEKIRRKKVRKADKGNDFLAQFWDELPGQKTEGDVALNGALSFDYLFESASNNFSKNVKTNEIHIDMELFEYSGSLTTPPYTEGVQWFVSKKTHYINSVQLAKLSACWGNHNNARPVQEYFGRTVSLRSKSSLRVVT